MLVLVAIGEKLTVVHVLVVLDLGAYALKVKLRVAGDDLVIVLQIHVQEAVKVRLDGSVSEQCAKSGPNGRRRICLQGGRELALHPGCAKLLCERKTRRRGQIRALRGLAEPKKCHHYFFRGLIALDRCSPSSGCAFSCTVWRLSCEFCKTRQHSFPGFALMYLFLSFLAPNRCEVL